MEQAGFREVDVHIHRVYDLSAPAAGSLVPGVPPALLKEYADAAGSAYISASKPKE